MFVHANENLLVITKTVAYFATKFITAVKSFMLQALDHRTVLHFYLPSRRVTKKNKFYSIDRNREILSSNCELIFFGSLCYKVSYACNSHFTVKKLQ